MEKAEDEEKQKKKGTFWSSVFTFLDKVHLKKLTTRRFIFRPPKNVEYRFEKVNDPLNGSYYEFTLTNNSPVCLPYSLDIRAHKIFSKRKKYDYMVPLIYVYHKEQKIDEVIIYSHGNASDLATTYKTAVLLAKTFNINVVAYDYTGYGISPNRSSEKNSYKDLEDVLSYVVAELKYPIFKIFLWSFSLGSGPTIEIATRYKYLAGIILAAPFASCLTWLDKKPSVPKDYKKSDIFPNINKIDKVGTKILIFHGDSDDVVPLEHSKLLYEKAITVKEDDGVKAWLIIIQNADHNSIFGPFEMDNSDIIKQFVKYLNHLRKKIDNKLKKLNKILNSSTTTSTSTDIGSEKSLEDEKSLSDVDKEMKILNDKFKTLEIDQIESKKGYIYKDQVLYNARLLLRQQFQIIIEMGIIDDQGPFLSNAHIIRTIVQYQKKPAKLRDLLNCILI